MKGVFAVTQFARPLAAFVGGRAAAVCAGNPTVVAAKVFGGLNLLGFGVSCATGSHVHLDLIGTGAFCFAAAATRGPGARSALSTAMVAVWGARLAGFLFWRASQTGHDARLEETLSSVAGCGAFWTISLVWGCVTLLPHTLAARCAATAAKAAPLGLACAPACALYALGLATEVLADAQKWKFKADPANKGKFCDSGVWALSQHPNYFGNLCLWSGVFLLNAPALAPQTLALAALSPLLLAGLFWGQATGAITKTTEQAQAKYGRDPAFAKYVVQVPLIVPNDPLALLKELLGFGKPKIGL